MLEQQAGQEPSLPLPSGGQPVAGLPVSFDHGGSSGVGTLSVPINTTAARGVSPDLTLRYHPGGGNGDFGLGFSLDLPGVARSTMAGVPAYTSADTFTLTGIGLLTPALGGDGAPDRRKHTDEAGTAWAVETYRPVAEGTLPLIERWTAAGTGDSHWRVVDQHNTASRFGVSAAARVADPDDPARVFQWLVEEQVDAHGNRIVFEYRPEDATGIPDAVNEQGRDHRTRRYPYRIRYGNYRPGPGDAESFAYEIRFDYGEHDLDVTRPGCDPYAPVRPWPARADAFSSYLPGFETRTHRRCRAVLTFHLFPAELGTLPCLVRATRFDYQEDPAGALLTSVTDTGYRRGPDGYRTAQEPPVTLAYAPFAPPPAPRFVPLDLGGPADGGLRPVDLDGVGVPGLLTTASAAAYRPPLGDGRFGPPAPLPRFPAVAATDPRLFPVDLDGDGGLALLVVTPPATGFFARRRDGWSAFTPLAGSPTMLSAVDGEWVDLDGDGRPGLLFLRGDRLSYHRALGARGFAPVRELPRRPGLPSAGAAGPAELVTFADVVGDGLAHRIRVSDGLVEIWPNLGHGRFGPVVRMADPPRFAPGASARRVFMADVDGSGAADLVLAYADRLEVHRNRGGNSFAPPYVVPLPTHLGALDRISFVDLFGTGRSAVVVSQAAPVAEHWYCDLAGAVPPGERPLRLVGIDNGLGLRTRVEYASSAAFCLADRRAGRPWTARMTHPVQVVARVETHDQVTGVRVDRRYHYRDGYQDPLSRRFAGFRSVSAWERVSYPEPAPVPAPAPVLTRSWYHTGRPPAADPPDRDGYFAGDPDAGATTPGTVDLDALEAGDATIVQAYRAMQGRLLRHEVWSGPATPDDLDRPGAAEPAAPLLVTEVGYQVRLAQPAGAHGPGAFYVHERETLTHHYEGDARDPRVTHTVTLADTLLDEASDVDQTFLEQTCEVAYPRRRSTGRARVPEQDTAVATVRTRRRLRATRGMRMVGPLVEERVVELDGVPVAGHLTAAELAAAVAGALRTEVPYGTPFGPGPGCRPVTWARTYFWNEPQDAPLPLGQVSARALVHHSRQAVFGDAWLAGVFGDRVGGAELAAAGYERDTSGYWWAPGTVVSYHGPGDFHLPYQTASPAAAGTGPGPYAMTTVEYDAPYRLTEVAVTHHVDAATRLTVTGEVDYQAARRWQVVDANGVVRQVRFDPLGAVEAASVFKPAGAAEPRTGDGDLRGYTPRGGASVADVLAAPDDFLQQAGEFHHYRRDSRPAACVSLRRPRDDSGGPEPALIDLVYSSGTGEAAERRRLTGDAQWSVVARTAYGAGGEALRQWLPFHAATPDFAAPPDPAAATTVHHDPLGRPVRVDTAKGLFTRTEYGAWQERDFDENDTVPESAYYRAGPPADPTPAQAAERAAAEQAARFADTPRVRVLDPAGHPVYEVHDALGDITPDVFADVVAGTPVGAGELWGAVRLAGYLATGGEPAATRVTDRFTPYAPGFALRLDPPYDRFAAEVEAVLRGACLTGRTVVDVRGRPVRQADPRRYLDEVRGGTAPDTGRYAYPMGSSRPALDASADAGTHRLLRDVLGREVLAWDGRDVRRARTYDGLDRPLTTVLGPDPGRLTEVFGYGDGLPDGAPGNRNGRLVRVQDASGVVLVGGYSPDGQPLSTSRQFTADATPTPDWTAEVPLDPAVYRTDRRYDTHGRLRACTTPDGVVQRLRYDRAGRLAGVSVDLPDGTAQTLVPAIGYDAADRHVRLGLGDRYARVFGYDPATGRLTSLRTETAGGAAVQATGYTYDPAGNVAAVRDETPQLVLHAPPVPPAAYRYDGLDRLREATGVQAVGLTADSRLTGLLTEPGGPPRTEEYTERFRYDDAGNLVSVAHAAPSGSFVRALEVRAGANHLAGVSYDDGGYPAALDPSRPTPLTWDAHGNLAAVDGARPTRFGYDLAGRRTRTVTAGDRSGGTVERRYLGDYVEERVTGADPAATPVVSGELRVGTDPMLAVVHTGGQPPRVRYPVTDRLGSVVLELTGDAGVHTYEAFLPYGGSALLAGADPAAVAGKARRYAGKEIDDGTGLYYYGARYYAPWLGRWLSPDPAGTADGLNRFAFVRGNPTTLVDPHGYNGDPPGRPSTFENFMRSALANMRYAMGTTYVDGPTALYRLYFGSPEQRAKATARSESWWEVLRLGLWHGQIAYGWTQQPARQQMSRRWRWDERPPPVERPVPRVTWLPLVGSLKPETRPLVRWFSLVRWGVPLEQVLGRGLNRKQIVGLVGGILGSFLTAGVPLAAVATALTWGRRRPLRIAAGTTAWLAGSTLNVMGRLHQADEAYEAHRAARQVEARQQSFLRRTFNWQAHAERVSREVTGESLDRLLFLVNVNKAREDQFADWPVSGFVVVVAAGLYGRRLVMRHGTKLTARALPSIGRGLSGAFNQAWAQLRGALTSRPAITAPPPSPVSNAVVVYRPPVADIVPYRPPISHVPAVIRRRP